MELAQLRHLIAIGEHASIGQAARSLNMTQPGLTKSIRRLEQTLAATLVVRRSRGVELTPQGRALVAHAKLIQLQVADARRELAAGSGADVARLAIGAGPSWLSRHLPTAVGRVLDDMPGLRVKITGGFNDRLFELLTQGELDVVIAALPDGPLGPDLAAEPLTHDDLHVVARAAHPFAARAILQARDLQQARWILPGREVAARLRLEAVFMARSLAPPFPEIESDSISFILATLRESDFLSFATRQLLTSAEAASLVSLAVPGFSVRRKAGLVYRARAVPTRPAELLSGHLRSICKEQQSQN